ncbi:MAG: efflux RND transporter periplasmic adaptor subunit, partial [Flavobacteriales bacterium]|nr:efflux RND transporter periplasmic adaptor subunit [Flavobacteriales bacterium]
LLNIDLANVNAPFSGQLGMRNFSVGAFLNTGDPVTTLTELENMNVDSTLAQSYANSLSVGDSIEVMIGKDTLQASVYAMSPVIDPQSRTINVRALLPQKKDRIIMPGSYAEVRITANAVDSALLIPTQAVVPEINDQTVYLYKNGKAVRRKIQTGHRTPAMIHVVDGLSAGDTVLTTGLLGVKEGMDITLQSTR